MKLTVRQGIVLAVLGIALVLGPAAVAQESQPPPQNPPTPPAKQPPASSAQQTVQVATEPAVKAPPGKLVLAAGSRLPCVLHNSVTTRNARPGDQIFLEVLFPILAEDRIVVPAGSYVYGEVVSSKRPGRAQGRGELSLKANKMLLPNGYVVSFSGQPSGAGTGGNEEVDAEGKIKGDTDRMSDVGAVLVMGGMGAGVGAGLGSLAGSTRMGAGLGTAIGLGAGIATILATRGPEVELPRGSTLDVMLTRPLYLDEEKVRFTDPGTASMLSGPPNRQPQRRRWPY